MEYFSVVQESNLANFLKKNKNKSLLGFKLNLSNLKMFFAYL